MKYHEKWIRERLPEKLAGVDLSQYFEEYELDGLTVTAKSELGENVFVYEAKDEDDLRLWEFDKVCRDLALKAEAQRREENPKNWRYKRASPGVFVERKSYDYDAVEDLRLYNFEAYLRLVKPVLPPERWEERVREQVALMNRRFGTPHWDYDRDNLCFTEISASRERSDDGEEEPGPGAVIKITD